MWIEFKFLVFIAKQEFELNYNTICTKTFTQCPTCLEVHLVPTRKQDATLSDAQSKICQWQDATPFPTDYC